MQTLRAIFLAWSFRRLTFLTTTLHWKTYANQDINKSYYWYVLIHTLLLVTQKICPEATSQAALVQWLPYSTLLKFGRFSGF